jgi:hypothetical protein
MEVSMARTFRAAARELGIPVTTMTRHARRIGIDPPGQGRRRNITNVELERLRAAIADASVTRRPGRPPRWDKADRSLSAREIRRPPLHLPKHGLPEQCPGCGVRYADTTSGLTFATARVEVVCSAYREEQPFFGRGAVIAAMRNRKLLLWREHIESCGAWIVDVSDARWRVERGRWFVVLDADAIAHLEGEPGDAMIVDVDGERFDGVLDSDHRVTVQARWSDLVMPASWIRISSAARERTAAANENEGSGDVPF